MTGSENSKPIFYKTRFPWASVLLLLICGSGFLISIPFGYLSYSFETTTHGTARALNSTIPFLCMGTLFALIGLAVIISFFYIKPVEVKFETEYIQIKDKSKTLQIVYSEIQQIFRKDELNIFLIFPIRKKDVKIQTAKGIAKIEGNIRRFDKMVDELESRVYPAMYIRALDILANKKALKFGPILLNQRGIKIDENIIQWDQVAGVTVVHGKVLLRYWLGGKIQEQKFTVGSMPNLPIFLKLSEENIHSAGKI